MGLDRRGFFRAAAGFLAAGAARADGRPPNIVLILADDLGYGDLGCYGSRIPTPNIDQIASAGMRFSNYYAANSLCSPSRAGLLTGKYPSRVGISNVLFPGDEAGLSSSESTIPRTLLNQGYRTACVGKWHLGATPESLPTAHGFQEFFGIPYSHDMYPVALMNNKDVVETSCRVETLTSRFTARAASFIAESAGSPFFLSFNPTNPHVPLRVAPGFRGKSRLGPYGDSVAELDWSVGEVMRAVRDAGQEQNTLFMFTSDNGPWYQGSAGVLRGRKGESHEGGVRVPMIARFPGVIPEGTVSNCVATALDLHSTFARFAGASAPIGTDGVDISPLLGGQQYDVERDILLFFSYDNLQCARLGNWKLHVSRYNSRMWNPDPIGGRRNLPLRRPELYDLSLDPGEGFDVSDEYPATVAAIRARVDQAITSFPLSVRRQWADTMGIPVEETEPGALPVPKN